MQHNQSDDDELNSKNIDCEDDRNAGTQPEFSNYVINYQKRVEEIIVWLFDKEEKLKQRLDENSLQDTPFNEVLQEYSIHEKFIEEFCGYSNVIMKCKEDGLELIDGGVIYLTEEDKDEIGIQMDTMMVCYEKLKILSTDRLVVLRKIIEERQESKIDRFEQWLTATEGKMAKSMTIGPDLSSIDKQLKDIENLRHELERKQEFLDFMSNIVIFDEVDADSMQIRSRSCESLNGRLEGVNSRWQGVCSFVNDRTIRLQKGKFLWEILNNEGPKLLEWLKTIEKNVNVISDLADKVSVESQVNPTYLKQLISRSDELETEIKSKGQFYSSIQQRIKAEMDAFDDRYSMLFVELEKTLEEVQDNWNCMLNSKRMLDYKLSGLSSSSYDMNSASHRITSSSDPSNNHLTNNFVFPSSEAQNGDDNITFDSSPSGNFDKDSSLNLGSSLSDSRPIQDNSLSSRTRFSFQGVNDKILENNLYDENDSQDALSTSNSMTNSFPFETGTMAEAHFLAHEQNFATSNQVSDLSLYHCSNQVTNVHHCRVEEWKHSLESFSTWLKGVEISLNFLEGGLDSFLNIEQSLTSQPELSDQLLLLVEIESQINTNCQAEFDCLIVQGQQIIADLIPEIGGNEYERNLKEILADIEMKYARVKRSLDERKRELADRDRWLNLSERVRNSSNLLIEQMGKIIPETEIGTDLIALAQQQDELIRAKSDLENGAIQSSMQEAKFFLKVCEILQQQFGRQSHLDGLISSVDQQERISSMDELSFRDIWILLSDLYEEIESQLDRVNIHHSELSQLIDDRLERLDEVHKEMHALQHSMQEFATKLQVVEIIKSDWGPLDDLTLEQLSDQLEDLKMYRERMAEVAATHETMNSIFDWMSQSEVPLSQQNLKRLNELNSIWSIVQMAADERQSLIEQAFDNQSASEQKFLTQTLSDLPNWERRVATSKVPYFVDKSANKTLWDHPKFTDMLNSMNSVQQVVYSAYRTALKLRIVQKKFGIDLLMLEQLKEIFNTFKFNCPSQSQVQPALQANGRMGHANPNCPQTNLSSSSNNVIQCHNNDTLADVEQIIHLLGSIYEHIKMEEKPNLDVPLAIDLTLNWFLNLYDSTRTGYISVISLKVGLALICCATREEKYTYLYELIANQDGCADGRRLGTLFDICIRIPTYLGEGASFGGTEIIEKSIRDCFAISKFNPDRPSSIELSDYLNWLKTEPQFIIWLPVLHRILVSENTHHKVRCKLCRAKPIIGLRYRCLKCLQFNICQNCFLIGRHLAEHPDQSKHPIHEYCYETGSGANVIDLSKILKNKLKLKPANDHRPSNNTPPNQVATFN